MKTHRLTIKRILWPILFLFVSCVAFADSKKTQRAFLELAEQYINLVYLPANPTLASQLGLHVYDYKIEDYSKTSINHYTHELKKFENKLTAFPFENLNEWYQGDYYIILNNIRSQLLTLQKIRPWEKNPNFYVSNVMNSIFVILQRNSASLSIRMQNLISREKSIPAILNEAKENLKNPPKVFTQIALEQLPDIIDFFQNTVRKTFDTIKDEKLKTEFNYSNQNVIDALYDYQKWLANKMLPISKGEFRIGKALYQKKLFYDEMVETPLSKLLKLNTLNMHENQVAFLKLARKINKKITPQEILAKTNHKNLNINYNAQRILLNFEGQFDQLIEFIKLKKILSLPEYPKPHMQETPAYMRATTSAAMDTPGPYEKSKQAYFYVTLPDPKWDKKQILDFMKVFSPYKMTITAIHETYPGHYVQFLISNKLSDRIRQIFVSNTNNEGWAHYCEQMMLDEGYVGSLHNKDLLRLSQLNKALLRNGRFEVGIKLHTGEMTFDQAVHFFEKKAYQSHATALLETKRATEDPLYLYYTLGKLQILSLRKNLMKKEGKNFSLQKFHDDFIKQGFPPIKIIEKAMLHV